MFSVLAAAASIKLVPVRCHKRRNFSPAWNGVNSIMGRPTSHSVPHEQNDDGTMVGNGVTSELILPEKMIFGSFENDKTVYKESFVIRSSHVGLNKTATVETIASLLQETACNRAICLGWLADGFPTPPTMRKHRLTWITFRVHIEMYKYPAWGDVVEIEHWFEPDGRIAVRLDFIIRNLSTGEMIGRSTRKCLMMNKDTRKLQKMTGEVRDEVLATSTKSPRYVFAEENNQNSKKISKLNKPADYSQLGLKPRRADLDMNNHVNNVTYYSWLLQGIPQDIVDTHEVEAITIEYRQECQFGDSIDSFASTEVDTESLNPMSEGRLQFLHLLQFSGTDHEINRGRTVWRKLQK
ncbi:Acyl-[acyl-carrier-protein] hydrolase [Rhynchospora pubera]|uniref:Acyl-[acyl-carrier-protein] hydrolase n=1 Tax=Rhynchospora pubera TaxID=906938 RepID=A0AAV8ER41_9POAL|nr:Acyl-[acyl-carrier-protein] hydrolase [Rhynchospora pubera]